MTVDYVTRFACGMYNDVQVVRIRFTGSGCDALNIWLADPFASVASKGLFLQKAQNVAGVAAISSEFTMKWNSYSQQQKEAMKCPAGTSLWRAIRGSCWYVDRPTCGPGIMVSCPNSACCLQNFTLCMADSGVKVEFNSIQQPQIPCGAPVDPSPCSFYAADGHCYFMCDNDGLEDILPPSKIKKEEDPEISKQDGVKDQDEIKGNIEAHIIHN
ncbi:MAG: hypothetical protein IT211_07720 [Armatimonadetes bacterium]|nr:hypothetical protein [Armatimonadota bacterium]